MRFWDASALIPLIVSEDQTDYCLKALNADSEIMVWTLSEVEVCSALCRKHREGFLSEAFLADAMARMNQVLGAAFVVAATTSVKQRALRLLHVHALRAADALQLSAALVAVQEEVHKMPVMCFDDRLCTAARREGFIVNPP
jgi:predicted nucleic acid-binding protein